LEVSHRITQLRSTLHKRLVSWLPNDNKLVEKELQLFDSLMKRRNFLKTTSFAAIAAFINTGCGDSGYSGPPSSWDDSQQIDTVDQASVQTASRIAVDADIIDSLQSYNALPAAGSVDAPYVVDSAHIESFNPHIMTIDSPTVFTKSGLNPLTYNYGIPELIHLSQTTPSSDYTLEIYEEDREGHGGLKEASINLDGSAAGKFNVLVASNGNFHNHVNKGVGYSQKLALLAHVGANFNYGDTSKVSALLYYQTTSTPLLKPGVSPEKNSLWKSIDVMEVFKQRETHPFNNYTISEVDTYHDGMNNRFIYGTLTLDDFYSYGFIITYNSLTDTKPTITFFAPKYLSTQSTDFIALVNAFSDENLYNDSPRDLKVFKGQTFKPLAQSNNSDGTLKNSVIFSFFSFDITIGSNNSYLDLDDSGLIDISVLSTDTSIMKRYIVVVDTSKEGVKYLFENFTPTLSLENEGDPVQITFDMSGIPSVDIWSDLYDQNNYQLSNMFTRFVQTSASEISILLATSFYDQISLGITNKSITLSSSGDGYRLSKEVLSNNVLFENVKIEDGKDYQTLWFDDMKVHVNNYNTLVQCVNNYNGILDFHCAHNHQGLLRSYFHIRYENTDGSINSFLIGFNEKGITNDDSMYAYQTHDNLLQNMINNKVYHRPPLPIAINPYKVHKWQSIAHDGEVMYSAYRANITDETTKTLLPNDGSQGILLSYKHATCDALEDSWVLYEKEKQVQKDQVLSNLYTIATHQLHLHTTNIYGHSVALDINTYVEVRFSKTVMVRDYTDVTNPRTYSLSRLSSLFLKPDSSGKVILEVDTGTSKKNKYLGATMMYRFVDASMLSYNDITQPVATLVSTLGSTTEFKQCGISFKTYERLSSGSITDTNGKNEVKIEDKLTDTFDTNYQAGVSDVTLGYSKLHDAAKPDNDSPLQNAAFLYTKSISRRAKVSLVLRSDVALVIDPLTFTPMIQSNSNLSSGSFISNAIHWVSHALDTIADLALAVAAAARAVISKLVEDIKNIVIDVSHSVSDWAHIMADFILKAAKEMYDIALELWEFIKMLIGMQRCYDIGQELKQLYYDQFHSASMVKDNVYSIIKDKTTQYQTSINKTLDDIEMDIDVSIDNIFGISTDSSSNVNKGNIQYKFNQNSSTKSDHVTNQLGRFSGTAGGLTLESNMQQSLNNETTYFNTSSNIESAQYRTSCSDSESIESLITCLGSEAIKKAFSGLGTISSDSYTTFIDLISGESTNILKNDLSKIFKDTLHVVLDEMKLIADGVIEIPLTMLNGSSIADALSGVLNALEKLILEALGLLFFLNPHQFKDMEDFAYFCFGYAINSTDHYIGFSMDFNLGDYVKDGHFRNSVNGTTALNSVFAPKYQRQAAMYIDTALSVTQTACGLTIASAKAVNFPKPTLFVGIKQYAYIGRMAARSWSLGVVVKNSDNSLDSISQTYQELHEVLTIADHLMKMVGENESFNKEYISIIITLSSFTNILAKLFPLLDTIRKTDVSDSVKILKLTRSILSMVQAIVRVVKDIQKVAEYKNLPLYYKASAIKTALTIINSVLQAAVIKLEN